jgi:hypothetical protein
MCVVCLEENRKDRTVESRCSGCWIKQIELFGRDQAEMLSNLSLGKLPIVQLQILFGQLEDYIAMQKLKEITDEFVAFKTRMEIEVARVLSPKEKILEICVGLRCPGCKAIFHEQTPDGTCLHATCPLCAATFCGLCFDTGCDTARCSLNPRPNTIHMCKPRIYKPISIKVLKIFKIAESLRPLSLADREQLMDADVLAKMREIGLDLPFLKFRNHPVQAANRTVRAIAPRHHLQLIGLMPLVAKGENNPLYGFRGNGVMGSGAALRV